MTLVTDGIRLRTSAPAHLVLEVEAFSPMFTPQPIGFISSPYKNTKEIPKGLGAKHDVEGVLKIMPELEPGLTDIEGFSHLIVVWEFDRSPREELRGTTSGVAALRQPATWCICHAVSATSESDWPYHR